MPVRFGEYYRTVKPLLDAAISARVSRLLADIPVGHGSTLQAVLQGGKKIRGVLLCMISEALGADRDSALPRAVAVELIQTATLIHDDVVDQDSVRRGMPAVWTLEGLRRAVLLGDVIFASTIEMMSQLSREDGLIISRAIAMISKGACHEPLEPSPLIEVVESNGPRPDLYERIIHLKTAVLFGVACELGAVAAAVDGQLRDRSLRYGLRIGEAYQIADDLKDLRQHLSRGSIDPEQMAPLVPTLLHFVEETRPHVLAILRGRRDAQADALRLFRLAAQGMQLEIDRRLKAAVGWMEEGLPRKEYSELLQRAPRELIGMFNRDR